MKIIIINGSHRPNGNCESFSETAKKILELDNEVALFNLFSMNIQSCRGCLKCEDGLECNLSDDYKNILMPALIDADLIIFATPTYFNMPSGVMANFLDRTNNLCDFFTDNTKNVLTFISGQTEEESLLDTYNCMKKYYDIMCMNEICEPLLHIARHKEDLSQDIIAKVKDLSK